MHQYQMYMSHTQAENHPPSVMCLQVSYFVWSLDYIHWYLVIVVTKARNANILLFPPFEIVSVFYFFKKGPFYMFAITLKLSLLHVFILPPQIVADTFLDIF